MEHEGLSIGSWVVSRVTMEQYWQLGCSITMEHEGLVLVAVLYPG